MSNSTPLRQHKHVAFGSCGDFSGMHIREGNAGPWRYVTKWDRTIPRGSAIILPWAAHGGSTCPHSM